MMEKAGVSFSGYAPGVIGEITRCHAVYYNRHWGFDKTFEIQVAGELASFIEGFDPICDGLWVAGNGSAFIGSVAVDGHSTEPQLARLRWFIVEPEFQGRGIGSALIEKAVAFAVRRRFKGLFLWTFEGLNRAKSLYERHGFRLSLEHDVDQWGRSIREQRFDLII
ncbi:MAG: GNAT family N-acetyltransferase [Desulfobacteraceae bacterium]